jgi:hypothetical protein
MLKSSSLLAGLFAINMMVAPVAVRADPIPITRLTLTILPLGERADPIHLEGPRGFTLDAVNVNFLYEAYLCDGTDTACAAGNELFLNASSGGEPAHFTLDGQSFGTGINTPGGANVAFIASMLVPSFTGAETVSVFTPFSFFGAAVPPEGEGVSFEGSGTLRVDLAWGRSFAGLGPGWLFQRATYKLQSPGVVPEPATLVLLSSGLGVSLMRRRRRDRLTAH